MRSVVVILRTDHTDDDEAIRSVSNGLKRAGYEIDDFDTRCHEVRLSGGLGILSASDGLIEAREPEVEPKY